ncbi:hypothetical protein [Synoicihabitans lomoniglobus]|uniref:DUF455 family protein n=1 Tax=Synoicihabitans lomoniglobus TaxID=2909285 RepID=A0AAF0CNM4_9BACT|nr:hypothetical protein [Opitutaceae bacterium LMO-M01]WED64716.1 hypothetical protein PXH66_20425 [Opitutaceae bacterium LMO-M01]
MIPLSYHSYRDLPLLAGIASLPDAMRIGLSIDDCVGRLKRHHWAFRRLHQIFVDRLTAEPVYELKMGFSLHAHYCAEHAAVWRKRVAEMREPPLGLDVVPDAALDAFFDEILCAPDTETLLIGLYEHTLPALGEAIRRHMAETNRLVDHPSFRICRFAVIEIEEMVEYGTQCVARLLTEEKRAELASWGELLAQLLRAAGGLDGAVTPEATAWERHFSKTPHVYDGVPQRDERFPDPYNMGVHAEAFLYDDNFPAPPKPLMMYFKRLREIDVPEMMASIITETTGKPWSYQVDMTRQLWDEARHAMMGEVGFVRAGIDWQQFVRVNFTWSLALNAQLTPLERHGVLYFIEQGLMPKTGKRFEWEVGLASGDPFSAMIQDYDWADEVLHARIGRDWYVPQLGGVKEAIAYGDQCWSKVLIDWNSYREQGLTQHENWWPALYREWCRVQGREPDAAVLAYDTSYAAVRADLRELSVSG